jgi:hypothetical protein
MRMRNRLIGWSIVVSGFMFCLTSTAMVAIVGSMNPSYSILKLYQTGEFGAIVSSILLYQGVRRLLPPRSNGTVFRTDSPWRAFEDLGIFLFVLALVVLIHVQIGLYTVVEMRKLSSVTSLTILKQVSFQFVYFILLPLGALSLWHSRRLSQPSASLALRGASSPGIVLLRAFRDDDLHFPRSYQPAGLPYWRKFLKKPVSLEFVISMATAPFGFLVALGSPRDRTLREGAFRDKVAERWRERVASLISRTYCAIVVVEGSPNLAWEVRRILRIHGLQALVLVFPAVADREKATRWKTFVAATGLESFAKLPRVEEISNAICISFPSGSEARIGRGDNSRPSAYAAAIAEALRCIQPVPLRPIASATGEQKDRRAKARPLRLYTVTQIVTAAVLLPISGLVLILVNHVCLKKYRLFLANLFGLGGCFIVTMIVSMRSNDEILSIVASFVAALGIGLLWFLTRWSYDSVYQEAAVAEVGARSTLGVAVIVAVTFGASLMLA